MKLEGKCIYMEFEIEMGEDEGSGHGVGAGGTGQKMGGWEDVGFP